MAPRNSALKVLPTSAVDFRDAFLANTDAMAVVREDGVIEAANDALARLWKGSRADLEGHVASILCPSPAQHRLRGRAKAFTLGLLAEPGVHEDVAIATHVGEAVEFEARVVAFGRWTLLQLRDVRVRRELEEALVARHQELKAQQELLLRSQKLAALGELSAGIAHEINQPLQLIQGYAQELNHRSPTPEGTEIVAAVKRISAIIKNLRTFVRGTDLEVVPTDLTEVAQEVIRWLQPSFEIQGLRISLTVPGRSHWALADRTSFEQVLTNLLTNARDALLTAKSKSTEIECSFFEDPNHVGVSVSDRGPGMSPATLQRIFDPFFTTKAPGSGMGLGLSLCHGLTESMGGSLTVTSKVNQGSTFKLSLKKSNQPEGGDHS